MVGDDLYFWLSVGFFAALWLVLSGRGAPSEDKQGKRSTVT